MSDTYNKSDAKVVPFGGVARSSVSRGMNTLSIYASLISLLKPKKLFESSLLLPRGETSILFVPRSKRKGMSKRKYLSKNWMVLL